MKILLEVLVLLMLSKFKHITTDVIQQPKMVNGERFRSTMFGQYVERNETKYSKKLLRRVNMYPRMESSCRKCGLKYRSQFRTLIIRGDLVHPTYLYPWMVAMTKEGELLCTGTIINAYFILTASHCLVKNLNEHKVLERQQTKLLIYYQPEDIGIGLLTSTDKLRVGPPVQKIIPHTQFKPSVWEHDIGLLKLKNLNEHTVLERQQTKPLIYYQPEDIGIGLLTSTDKLRVGPPVQKIIPHTKFKPSVWEHDIGLLKLKEKIICSKFANPICLPPPDFHLPIGAKMTISGFGSYNGSIDALGKLRQSKVTEERFKKCPFPRRLERYFYCLKSVTEGQVACYGDSGGPMFYEQKDKFYILGVSSFGKSCDKKLPFLYTSVPHHLRWIYKNMDLSSTTGKGLRGSGKGKCNKYGRK